MSHWNILVGLALVVWLIVRQLQVRPVKERKPYQVAWILGVIGVVEIANYLGGRPLPPVGYLIMAVRLLVAALFGYLRARVTAVWRRDDGVLVRQGNAVAAVLWVVGIALHLGTDLVLRSAVPDLAQLGAVSLLLYLAVTIAAQRWVLTEKAARLAPA